MSRAMQDETRAIQRTKGGPVTGAWLAAGLAAMGVRRGDRLLVHASLSSFGFVTGGAQAVLEALKELVADAGLLAAPAFTGHFSDPVHWRAPPVPSDWWPTIRSTTPAFDPAVSPSRAMGALSELMRTSPGAARGPHPQVSFTAWGSGAEAMVAPHAVDTWLGDGSPLQRLYDLDAKVLFLGTGYATCTTFHLGEHRASAVSFRLDGAPMMVEGVRTWVTFEAPDYDTEPFEALGAEFETTGCVTVAEIGAAECRLFPLCAASDFAEARARAGPGVGR